MSREDFDALREYCKQKHDERVAKTPQRLEYAKRQLEQAGIKYEVKNEKIGHIHAWNSSGKLFQFWCGTGKIFNRKERGIWHFVRIVQYGGKQ